MKPVLYISYDGLLDPLGYSQVQPYLKELAGNGVVLHVLSFEKRASLIGEEYKKVEESLAGYGICWHRLRYHKHPALCATLWDITAGFFLAGWLIFRHRIGILHARSYIAATIAWLLCTLKRMGFLFDMRGFWADERVEGGLWPAGGILYKTFKYLERKFLARADAVVVLSRRGAELLPEMMPPGKENTPVAVIPTCVDLEHFRPPKLKQRRKDCLRLVYLGSLGTWYLVQEMLSFFGVVYHRFPQSSFTVVTPAPPELLQDYLGRLELPAGAAENINVQRLPYSRVPESLHQADCSIFFIRPSFSKQASCATKFAESLACGLPVILNSGVGDHDRQVEHWKVGVVLKKLDEENYALALQQLLDLLEDPSLPARCRTAAEEDFSLAKATETYLELYRGMSAKGDSPD